MDLRGRRRARENRRRWESRWTRSASGLPWQLDHVHPAIERAFTDGWIPAGSSVADLGSGRGHDSAWLGAKGCTVDAFEWSHAAVEQARALHAGAANVTFHEADLSLPVRGATPHDVVIDVGCFHGFPTQLRARYGANVRRLTRSGSRLLYRVVAFKDEKTVDDKVDALIATLGHDYEVVQVTDEPDAWQPEVPAAEVRLSRN